MTTLVKLQGENDLIPSPSWIAVPFSNCQFSLQDSDHNKIIIITTNQFYVDRSIYLMHAIDKTTT
ncbi:hypothetical protein BGP82_18025 [Pseudomonas putida]|uniref:Uncharacterized protein n=1 Tax=Pseudomonas putida TaxID=303 RepID=A0A2S3WP80_PSEPU|nr:hypothetical protein BGP82_18025 [Pseudomonas putida]